MNQLREIDEIAGRDVAEIRSRIAEYLVSQGWDTLLGKQRGGEQTLLEHSLAVFDVLCACAPFFESESRPRIESSEFVGMLLATVAHDAGKVDPTFQAFLRGEATTAARHVSEEDIRKVVVGAAGTIGFNPDPMLEDIVSEAVLHDRYSRKSQPEMNEWAKPHGSPRWRKLADFVNHADSLASAEDIVSAEDFLRRNPLLVGAARVTSYQVRVRGVSTTFLHDAALETFEAAGFRPILFFANGTLFTGQIGQTPTVGEIERCLHNKLDLLFSSRRDILPDLVVGRPNIDFLPRPEYVRREMIPALLRTAWSKGRPKVRGKDRKKDDALEVKWLAQWEEQQKRWSNYPDLRTPLSEGDVQALFECHPEACAFKITKELFDKVLDDDDRAYAHPVYDRAFGEGAFARLMRQGSDNRVNDYGLCVRPWHALESSADEVRSSGAAEGGGEPARNAARRIGQLDLQHREEILLTKLGHILDDVFANRKKPLPCDNLVAMWCGQMVRDMAVQCLPPAREEVRRQFDGYASSKSRGRARSCALLQCAQCASLIEFGEVETPSAALDNKGSFSNRRLAFEPGGKCPPLCRACKVDIEVGTLCLGGLARTSIAIVPRRALGPQAAVILARRIIALRTTVDRQLSSETADPAKYVSLTFPGEALRGLSLEEASVHRVGEAKRKERLRDLEKALEQLLAADNLDELNDDYGTSFETFASLAQALMDGSAPAELRQDGDVKAALERVARGGRVAFAAAAPNLVILALDRPLGGRDEKDVDRALYGFGLGAMFALELGTACLVAPMSEIRTALASRAGRTVYVPANGPARSVLGGDWLGLADARRWLLAVRAAIALKDRAKANTLLAVLRYPGAGFLVRRIEQQTDGHTVGPGLWPYIEALKEVLR
jgi:hypothetical protein